MIFLSISGDINFTHAKSADLSSKKDSLEHKIRVSALKSQAPVPVIAPTSRPFPTSPALFYKHQLSILLASALSSCLLDALLSGSPPCISGRQFLIVCQKSACLLIKDQHVSWSRNSLPLASWLRISPPPSASAPIFAHAKRTAISAVPFDLFRQLLTFPGGLPPSIISVTELNFCVRNGYRCDLCAIATR